MKRKIAIIIQKLNGGGAERAASNLSILLGERYEVHTIVFDGTQMAYPISGKVYDLGLPPAKTFMGKVKTALARARMTKRIKRQQNITCSISLMDGANLVNVLSRSKDRILISVRIQMSASRFDKDRMRKKLQISFFRFLAKHAFRVISLSKGVEDDLNHNFGIPKEKLRTIYNPCDGEMLMRISREQHKDVETLPRHSLVTMGRLTKQKGHWHLIRAMKRVMERVADARLYLFGEGEMREELENLAREMGVAEQVIFKGYQKSPHVYIAGADAFVFPSIFEGLGNVLLEAMACGTACLACDCPSGPREILAPDTQINPELDAVEYAEYGVLTPICGYGQRNATEPLTREEELLAEGMLRLLEDDGLRKEYEAKGLERVQRFSPEAILREWEKVIENQ